MSRKDVTGFFVGEVYHVYNRGAHKADVFKNDSDYLRFQALLHVCNSYEGFKFREIQEKSKGDVLFVFSLSITHELVDVLGYCLMKNHVHLILRPRVEKGVEKFMQKVMTGYSMYANKRYEHSGTMWEGPFRAKHVDSHGYLWQLFAYIHVNPIEYIEKFWKDDKTLDKDAALMYLKGYSHSSFIDFYTTDSRPQGVVVSHDDSFTKWLQQFPRPKNLVEYYLKQDFSGI